MRVVREDFLQTLEAVKYGLAKRETVEQSSKFVFTGGQVFAYNYAVHCQAPSPFNGFTGAVFSDELLDMLRKFKDETLEVSQEEGVLNFAGKREDFDIRVDPQVALPLDPEARAAEWIPFPDGMSEALALASRNVGTNAEHFALTCVHVCPKWVEATDGYQMVRYRLDTGLPEPALVRGDAVRSVPNLGMTEYSLTPAWLFFRNPQGVLYGCRRHVDDYPDCSPFLKMSGYSELVLPKDLLDFVKKAQSFTKSSIEDDSIRVELSAGQIKVVGDGPSGRYSGKKKVKYQGPPVSFRIGPRVLTTLVKEYQECELNGDRIRIRGDCWKYVAKLLPGRNGKTRE